MPRMRDRFRVCCGTTRDVIQSARDATVKIFHCGHCGQLVFFENVRCLRCGHPLAYLPLRGTMASLEPDGQGGWRSPVAEPRQASYRLCANYDRENVCNWGVPAEDPNPLCRSCRLTRVIPDLSQPNAKQAWYRLEVAKRRLVYSLLALGLPVASKVDDPEHGLAFELRSEAPDGEGPVITGHAHGVITLNVAEADDVERERIRKQFHEPYRTLLGHFRHESGHYYWDRLIRDREPAEAFRERFGDERADYGEALKRHYALGAPGDWQDRFVSTYASAHPWEDWAETWAHYLHITDTLETAAACGLSIDPPDPERPVLTPDPPVALSFEATIERWFTVTFVLNNLNRGLGLADGYPFVLSQAVVDKLRFVHDAIEAAAGTLIRSGPESLPRA